MELAIETPPRTVKTVHVFSTKSITSKPWTCDVELIFEKGFILKSGEVKGVYNGVTRSNQVTSFHERKLREDEDCTSLDQPSKQDDN